jgi:hypothetical protein
MTPTLEQLEQAYRMAIGGCASDPERAGRELVDLRMTVADLRTRLEAYQTAISPIDGMVAEALAGEKKP